MSEWFMFLYLLFFSPQGMGPGPGVKGYSGGGALSWATLTNGNWTGLTNGQWTGMTN